MAIATEIKSAMSEAIQRQQRVHPYELTEAAYVDDRVAREIKQYERAIESEKGYLEQIKDKARPKEKEKVEWKIEMWGKQLARLKSGEWKKVNANYLHEQYAKMLKKAISTGQPVPQNIINQAPEYKAAQTARERYEKGWKTSFANRSVAINEQMKSDLGYKVKRQDGKPITSGQLDEIAKGVGQVEDVLGPLHDLFDNTDITIVHTSGKHPFLSGFGGTYTSQEKAVNIGVAGVAALGHELGHWLDFESGKAENLSSRIYSKAGKSHEITSTAESWGGRYKDQKPTALGQLIDDARFKINKMREVQEYMKADYGKDKSAEEKEQIKLVREHLTPYWREPREIWARLVEQYIATKRGKAGLATDSPEHYEHRPGWWTKEDFAKMMPQVETLIKGRLRVLRGSGVAPPRKTATAEKKLEAFADDVKQIEKTTPPSPETKAETKLLSPPAKVEPIKPVAKTEAIAPGDVITDGIVNGRVIAEGSVRMGKQDVPGYQIVITSGHQAGQKSIIPKDQAKLVRHEPERAPETPKPTPEAKVKGITYYRGVSRHEGMEAPTGERHRPSVYLTRSEREARFYGKDIEKVTVDPKNPMYSETAVDAAEKLGVIKDYDKYIGSDPIKADEVIYNAAKKAGYDAIIRRDGDWVQVIDKGIISPVGGPTPEAKEPWKMTQKEYLSAHPPKGKGIGGGRWSVLDWHKSEVLTALTQGKPVPAEVLKDYPELGKKGAAPNLIQQEADRIASIHASPEYKKAQAEWQDARQKYGLHAKETLALRDKLLSLTTPGKIVKVSLQPKAKPEPKAEARPKGELIAKFAERKMSPSTGQDTDYVHEWRLVEKPDDAGPEWMGNNWGIERIFTKGGEVQSRDLMETADTKEKVIKLLPRESVYDKAEKYGLAKTHDEQRAKEKAAKEAAEKVEQEKERQAGERYEQRMKELGTRKGVTKGTISMSGYKEDWKTEERRDVPGLIIGKGIGVVIHGEGRRKSYTVTHLNTGKAMGHAWESNESKEAIALAKAIAEVGDWSKYQEEKDVPKSMMDEAAALVRGFTGRKLEPTKAKVEPRHTIEAEAKAMGLSKSQIAQAKKEGVTTALGLRRIEKTTRGEAKPKKEPKALKTKPVMAQSDRALAIDRGKLAMQVVPAGDARWLTQRNRFDVRGIDTPGSGRVTSRTGFTDKGKTRMSRKHHRGWKRIKL